MPFLTADSLIVNTKWNVTALRCPLRRLRYYVSVQTFLGRKVKNTFNVYIRRKRIYDTCGCMCVYICICVGESSCIFIYAWADIYIYIYIQSYVMCKYL